MGAIVNLTPEKVYMYFDVGRATIYPSSGTASVSSILECFAEPLIGEKVYRRSYGEIEGLPKPTSGVYFIVTPDVAEAARLQGRTVGDLLLLDDPVMFEGGQIAGYRKFLQVR